VTARINSPSLGAASYQDQGTWTASVSHRWQYSDRHFIGDDEQKYRQKENSEVINNIHLIDIGVGYAVSKRVSLTLSIPFQFATREQAVRDPTAPRNEFGNRPVIDRYQTSADGLGDLKLLGSVWLLDPEHNKRQNVSLGLGVLFPTGEKDHKDVFKVFDTNSAGAYSPRGETRNVDNSIQPGAGAWGVIFDLYSFAEVITNLTLFASGTYIAVPATDAGVISGNLQTSTEVWSTGDSYLFRAGLGYKFLPKQGLSLTLGARLEGSPPKDLFGSNDGRRRPGYAISIEPGLVYARNRWFASFSAPVALYRNRQADATGQEGDAAFADFITLFSIGYSW
jgi:hypothetical protein